MRAVPCYALILILILLSAHPNAARSQPVLDSWYVGGGDVVPGRIQQGLGLVSISGGCSGTLLNRHWVLTARHCVTTNGKPRGDLKSPDKVSVVAAWAPGHRGQALPIRDFRINTGRAGAIHDIVLFQLRAAFGLGYVVNEQRIYNGRLRTTDRVAMFGHGYKWFADGRYCTTADQRAGCKHTATPAGGDWKYRSARYTGSEISGINQFRYTLQRNANIQVGHAGDSGGPTHVTIVGGTNPSVGIAGVQSACQPSGYVDNLPAELRSWKWATGIRECYYVSTLPFISEIAEAINPPRPPRRR